MKTLIILTGQSRGNELTWNTMYDNLLLPHNADLALCFDDNENENTSLFKKATYIWKMRERDDWLSYFEENCSKFWKKNLEHGINGDFFPTVLGIPGFCMKHYIIKNYKPIIEKYDKIILTRSDHYFIGRHPILSNNNLWITEGEDYGSYCDRFYCFPSKYAEQVLNILEFIDSEELNILLERIFKNKNLNITPFEPSCLNTEYYYKLFFESSGLSHKIRRSPRVHFIVSTANDPTRTFKSTLLFRDGLYIKYKTEFLTALGRVNYFKTPNYIE